MIDFLLQVLKYCKAFYLWEFYLFGLGVLSLVWFEFGFFCENGNFGHMTKRKRDSVNTCVMLHTYIGYIVAKVAEKSILHGIYF